MTTQMTVRIDDAAARFVDEAADAGEGSRAEVINRALHREMQRRAAARDAEIYAADEPDTDEDAYARWAQANAAAVMAQ